MSVFMLLREWCSKLKTMESLQPCKCFHALHQVFNMVRKNSDKYFHSNLNFFSSVDWYVNSWLAYFGVFRGTCRTICTTVDHSWLCSTLNRINRVDGQNRLFYTRLWYAAFNIRHLLNFHLLIWTLVWRVTWRFTAFRLWWSGTQFIWTSYSIDFGILAGYRLAHWHITEQNTSCKIYHRVHNVKYACRQGSMY